MSWSRDEHIAATLEAVLAPFNIGGLDRLNRAPVAPAGGVDRHELAPMRGPSAHRSSSGPNS